VARDEPQVSVGGLLEQEIFEFSTVNEEWTKGSSMHQERRESSMIKGKNK
jgi:hypothetical protein